EPASERLAMLHPAFDLPGAAEEIGRGARPAGPQMLPDPRRREYLAGLGRGRCDSGHAEPVQLAQFAQQLRIAAPAGAEVEILPDHHMGRLEPLAQHLDDERLGTLAGELRVEMEDEDIVGADRLEVAHPDAERGEPERR